MEYEILAPAGSVEAIPHLISSGANAIYVGLFGCSSRPSSADLKFNEIAKAVNDCHQKNVKLYVAINACISERQINEIIKDIAMLDSIQVDAIILADWGLIGEAVSLCRYAKVHASTLLGVYNADTVLYLQKIGVARVVFSSNLYIDEIAKIIHQVPDMGYEIIADGGICFNDNRICELPHTIVDGAYKVFCQEDYHLVVGGEKRDTIVRVGSKQIESASIIKMYMELGILSYKIEGRTVDYQYIVSHVQKLKNALAAAKRENNNLVSTLHYINRIARSN